jgi:hypothetical protein
MFYNKFSKYKEFSKSLILYCLFTFAFSLDLLYSNVYFIGTEIKIPYIFFGLIILFVVFKLLHKYFLSSLRTNNFNYDL